MCSLASGSSGNCYYIGNEASSVLIDAGISAKEIIKRLSLIGKDIRQIKGVFVTHEHSDHILGIETLSRKYHIPVFLTKGTLENSPVDIEDFIILQPDKEVQFTAFSILPFSVSHDAAEPVGYSIAYMSRRASVMTDIGFCCDNVRKNISRSNALAIEANHDVFMLKEGPYPAQLKKRILGTKGHLSNYEAALVVLEYASSSLQHLFLSHLSKENNTQEIALRTFSSILSERKDLCNLKTWMTYRDRPTKVVSVD